MKKKKKEKDEVAKKEEIAQVVIQMVIAKSISENRVKQAEYNNRLEKFFTEVNESQSKGLTEKVFEENILKKFVDIFEDNEKIQTVYKVKFNDDNNNGAKNVKGILSPEGFKLLIFGNEIKKDELVKMIKNDFILNNKYKKQLGVRYNALQKLNKQTFKKWIYFKNVARTMSLKSILKPKTIILQLIKMAKSWKMSSIMNNQSRI
nr:hypothetical protein [Mycoplasmopsis bovis]